MSDKFDDMLKGALIGMVSYFISRLFLDFVLPDLSLHFWFHLYVSAMLIPILIIAFIVVDILRIMGEIRETKKRINEMRTKRLETLKAKNELTKDGVDNEWDNTSTL